MSRIIPDIFLFNINEMKGVFPLKIQESAENYLETILMLSRTKPDVRSIDVATELDFTKPSVSIAMKKLRESGHIVMNDGGYISLTDNGREIAERMYERHEFLSAFLIKLGVDPTVAVNDACRIEHVISSESFAKLKSFVLEHLDPQQSV